MPIIVWAQVGIELYIVSLLFILFFCFEHIVIYKYVLHLNFQLTTLFVMNDYKILVNKYFVYIFNITFWSWNTQLHGCLSVYRGGDRERLSSVKDRIVNKMGFNSISKLMEEFISIKKQCREKKIVCQKHGVLKYRKCSMFLRNTKGDTCIFHCESLHVKKNTFLIYSHHCHIQ